MNKVAATYWNNGYTAAARSPRTARHTRTAKANAGTPQWFVFTVVAAISLMLCMAINFRAFSDMRQEMHQNEQYRLQVENLTTENLAIQQEIHNIRTDESTIRREAQKVGFVPSK